MSDFSGDDDQEFCAYYWMAINMQTIRFFFLAQCDSDFFIIDRLMQI